MSYILPTRTLAATLFLSLAGVAVPAQTAVGGPTPHFKDTSMVKPPAGARVAIYEFEDMECPACAHAAPIVHGAVDHYKIPLLRHDFPLGPMHPWSKEAAVFARYLQDKVSPALADEYRRQIFATQIQIASPDDLHNFTVKFMQNHGQQMPFVTDPTGQFAREVEADHAIGEKIGLNQTPTIFVTTQKGWVQILDVSQLYSVIDQAMAQTAQASTSAHRAPVSTSHKKAS